MPVEDSLFIWTSGLLHLRCAASVLFYAALGASLLAAYSRLNDIFE